MLHKTTSDKRVRFKGNPQKEAFIQHLRERAEQYFTDNNISPYANIEMYLKTVLAIVAWLAAWLWIMSDSLSGHPIALYGAYLLLGFVHIFIALNIMHDAIHDAYSPKKWVNKLMGYSMNFIGGNEYLFRKMHGAHHGYLNIHGIDIALETHGLFRFSPEEPWLPRHKYQHIYTFIIYLFTMLQWVLIKDFKWFFVEAHIGNQKNIKHPTVAFVELFLGKLIFYGLTLVLPLVFLSASWYVVLGAWIFMHLLPGLTFALIFSVTHIFEGTTYPLPDADGNIDNNYALHVLETTADFSRNNRLGTWLMGSINIHVVHHLFPQVCHVHYLALARILKEVCDEHGIVYHENAGFWTALKKHYRILKHLSVQGATVVRQDGQTMAF